MRGVVGGAGETSSPLPSWRVIAIVAATQSTWPSARPHGSSSPGRSSTRCRATPRRPGKMSLRAMFGPEPDAWIPQCGRCHAACDPLRSAAPYPSQAGRPPLPALWASRRRVSLLTLELVCSSRIRLLPTWGETRQQIGNEGGRGPPRCDWRRPSVQQAPDLTNPSNRGTCIESTGVRASWRLRCHVRSRDRASPILLAVWRGTPGACGSCSSYTGGSGS